MGSHFEDLDATNPFPKTEGNLDIPFERYLFFRLRIGKRKIKASWLRGWDAID